MVIAFCVEVTTIIIICSHFGLTTQILPRGERGDSRGRAEERPALISTALHNLCTCKIIQKRRMTMPISTALHNLCTCKIIQKRMMTMPPPSAFCTLKLVDAARKGPRGQEPRCASGVWFLQRHEKPSGISRCERASSRGTQLNKGPAGLRATTSGAILAWCPRGLMSMRAASRPHTSV